MMKLVTYFSYSGVTRAKARQLAEKADAKLFELQPEVPYTESDVDWRNETSRNVLEYKDKMSRPGILELPDLKDVDEIWIGYPIWWYTHPRIIDTFFDEADLKGKRIHLFATSSSTGIEGSLKELKSANPELEIADGERM